MSQPATSLDRLHDLILPPEVPWWPPAPGWYAALAISLLLALLFAHRTWKRWRANAYRRAAIRELAAMESAPEIATLLRRTALAIAPRELVATMHGTAWLDWLSAQAREPMPDDVRRQLSGGIYAAPGDRQSVGNLRDYASRWISRHRVTEHCTAGPAAKPSPTP